jgi:hypothetical protein
MQFFRVNLNLRNPEGALRDDFKPLGTASVELVTSNQTKVISQSQVAALFAIE